MTELARLKFYATQPHPCSYLPEGATATLFLVPASPWTRGCTPRCRSASAAAATISIVRTASIAACIAALIPVASFSPNRQQRPPQRNAELQGDPQATELQRVLRPLSALHQATPRRRRHVSASRDQFATFLVRDLPFCCFFEFRLRGRLLA